MHTLLIINDENTGTETVATVELDIVRLDDFTYVNSTGHTLAKDVAADLNRFAGQPDPIRAAAYTTIRRWLRARDAKYTRHCPDLADDDRTAIQTAVDAWHAAADPAAAAAWDTTAA